MKCPLTNKNCNNDKYIKVSQTIKCCEECTKSLVAVPLAILTMNSMSILIDNYNKLSKTCKCGTNIDEVKSLGKLGCPDCYDFFKDDIRFLLPYIHNGAKKHVGKRPLDMEKAIREERYEDALRIKNLKENL